MLISKIELKNVFEYGVFMSTTVNLNHKPFIIICMDEGDLIGGALLEIEDSWLQINVLLVKDPGLGTKIMNEIEKEARKHNCIGLNTSTSEYQAPEFYQKMGFDVFGELENPSGRKKIYLKKVF